MSWIRHRSDSRRFLLTAGAACLALMIGLASAAPADASRKPTRAEAKAVKKGFLAGRDVKTKVRSVRVSTADPSYASVTYVVKLPEMTAVRTPFAARAPLETHRAPAPVVLKEKKGGKWKPTAKPPKKVKHDLEVKAAKSDIRISGEVSATLTRGASCSQGSGFYSAGIYNPGSDTYLSVEFPQYTGPHVYPALGVRSVASLAVGNHGGTPQFETGQGNDAFSPSGALYVDAGGWGLIEATMARQPDSSGTYPQSVTVSGWWDCR